jgi:3-dehydroquinate synthase II
MKPLERIILEVKTYDHELITGALESGINQYVVYDSSIAEQIRSLGSVQIISDTQETDPDIHIGKDITVVKILSKDDEVRALDISTPIVLIETSDWRIIPLENIVSNLEGSTKQVIVHAKNIDDAEVLLGTLERGVDAIILPLSMDVDIKTLMTRIRSHSQITLVSFKVRTIENVGLGDRVCVDTCSILNHGEGLLVGSQSNGFFLVHNENVDSPYADPRPFRVNAGAVHSYILMPTGMTKYLLEVKGGTRVLVCDSNGFTRTVTVGRSKIEKRPLMMITVDYIKEDQSIPYQVIVQNAETIRFVRSDESKSLVSVAKLKPGDVLLGYIEEGGRHFGKKITESIDER